MSSYFHTPTRISNIVTGLNNNNNKGLELHNWGNVNSGLVMKAGSGIPCLGVYEVGYKVFGHLIDTVGINEQVIQVHHATLLQQVVQHLLH